MNTALYPRKKSTLWVDSQKVDSVGTTEIFHLIILNTSSVFNWRLSVVHISIHVFQSPCTRAQTSFSIGQHYLHLIESITAFGLKLKYVAKERTCFYYDENQQTIKRKLLLICVGRHKQFFYLWNLTSGVLLHNGGFCNICTLKWYLHMHRNVDF